MIAHGRRLPLFLLTVLLAAAALLSPGCTPIDTSSAHKPPDSPFNVTFFDVGQGDAALISFQSSQSSRERTYVLVDTGTEPAARSSLIPALKDMGVASLDTMVVTHMDSDHAGGLFPVLESFPVKEIVLSGYFYSTEEYFYFIQRMQPYSTTPRFPQAGDYLQWGQEVTVEVLNPKEPYYTYTDADENNNSLVLEVTYGQTSFLFTGDIEEAAEARIARDFAGKVDLMKVPHHGSNSSSSPAFLAAFQPSSSIISCGRDNPYGHPSPKVVARLAAYGRVFRTDIQGDIYAGSDGLIIQVSTEK